MRRLCLLLLLLAVLFMAAGPKASADVVQAQSILPPGESGFVSIPGVTTGTGSPHLYDQQQPFINFARKDDMLAGAGATTETPRPGVTIARDPQGVPDVSAGNDPDAWWGAGYATAQDRLFELELFRRATTGHLAEILGRNYLARDIETRRDFYSQAELDGMYAALPQDLQQRYTSYLAGINAWVSQAQLDPSKLPAEFVATADQPASFTLEDLLAIGVFLARTTPNGDGSDLDNVRALDALGPSRFNQILPLRTPGQISTVPASSGLYPSVPGRTPSDESAALARSTAFVQGLSLPSGKQPSGSPDGPSSSSPLPIRPPLPIPANPIHVGGSYMVARGDTRKRHALLFSGPELGFSAPEELYKIEVRRPGLDARGVTAPGAPVIAIGHNAHVAWGLTSGLSQTNALYSEQLMPGNGEQYVFQGRTQTMSCRDETFTYRSPPTDLAATRLPQAGSETHRLCRTLHGPVQARAGGVAYARRYATWGREAATLAGLAHLDEAANIQDVSRASAELTWNENLMAADDRGHIGYWHPGLLPVRPKNWDERLPYPGTGEAEWSGFLSPAQRPHVIDPRQGWLANWNNIPSQGWTTGNDPASERVAGKFFRVAYLNQQVVSQLVRRAPTFVGLENVVHAAGTTAQQRSLAVSELEAAARGATGDAATVLQTILRWDGSYDRTDQANTIDPGAAAWQEFKVEAQQRALSMLGPGAEIIGAAAPNSEHLYDVSLGQAYALRTLAPADYRTVAAGVFSVLGKRFASSDPARWRDKRAQFPQSSLGAEQPPPLPFYDRGTWEQLVELASDQPAAPTHGRRSRRGRARARHRLHRPRVRFTG